MRWHPDERLHLDMRYLHQDHLGSTSKACPELAERVTDASGDAVFERSFDPWGNIRVSSGTVGTNRLFTGQRFDAATGLYYYNARYGACPERCPASPTRRRGSATRTCRETRKRKRSLACSRYTPSRADLHCATSSPSATEP